METMKMVENIMTSEERESFKATFDLYDINKDGHITSNELRTVMNRLGQNPTDQEIDEFIKKTDADKNGTIEFNEFCSYLVKLRRKVFKEIDADGDGYITPDEVVRGFYKLGIEISLKEAKIIVSVIDTDGDGRISYTEFVKSLQDRPFE